MPTDGEVRTVLRPFHGRIPGAQPDALAAQVSGQAGEPGLGELRLEKHPDKTFIGRVDADSASIPGAAGHTGRLHGGSGGPRERSNYRVQRCM